MRLLLHACCGPCCVYPVQFLRGDGVDFSLYFYNPNIHPYQEFKKRLRALREFADAGQVKLFVDKSYPLEDFLGHALAEPVSRCDYCYRVRMYQTARFAAENGFDAFSSTLLGSPYQKHEDIAAFAKQAACEYGVSFAYYDFRAGFTAGQEKAAEMGLYRQSYCGCIFSERDRYEKRKKE